MSGLPPSPFGDDEMVEFREAFDAIDKDLEDVAEGRALFDFLIGIDETDGFGYVFLHALKPEDLRRIVSAHLYDAVPDIFGLAVD